MAPEVELEVLERGRSRTGSLKAYLKQRRAGLGSDDFLAVIVPEVLRRKGLMEIIRHPSMHRLKAGLLTSPGVQVIDIPVLSSEIRAGVDQAQEPARNYACILVSGVHNAALQAIEFAETLNPTDIRAVSFGLDPVATEKLGDQWLAERIPHPLEIEDSPFRDIGRSLVEYVRQFRPDGVDRVVTVVLPEFVVKKRRHAVLHGQTALIVKRHLLFEPGVVVISVPYQLSV